MLILNQVASFIMLPAARFSFGALRAVSAVFFQRSDMTSRRFHAIMLMSTRG